MAKKKSSIAKRLTQKTSTTRKSPRRKPSQKSSTGKRSIRKKPASRSNTIPSIFNIKLSYDRKLDIIGILLVLLGLLTMLALFSPISSGLTEGWVSLIGMSFGIGRYLLSAGLVFSGGWLILRKFKLAPKITVERLVGVVLLLTILLACTHIYVTKNQEPFNVSNLTNGGGYIGALISEGLNSAFGLGGTVIVLIALFVISITLSFDLTVVDMVNWIPPVIKRFQGWVLESWQEVRIRWKLIRQKQKIASGYLPVDSVGKTQDNSAELSKLAVPMEGNMQQELADQQILKLWTWDLPPIDDILEAGGEISHDDEVDLQRARVIEESLASFGAPGHVVEINRGPTITQFGVEPDFIETRNSRTRVRVGKISGLADDLALALSARRIRIQAPVPGKGFVGIEVPNEEIALVALRDLIESKAFKRLKSPLRFALGQNVSGNAVAADLAAMPHLLIAGATGAGKSVCVNALISCLLMNNTPNDLRLIMVDPKRVELTGYNGIPHLLAPVVVDLEKVVGALQWVTREMDMRYRKLADLGTRNLQDFNAQQEANGGKKLPYLVVIIDELADLMMIAPDETERTITRLAQLARATGIHLIISTQRPSVDVVTGLIKANFPARIAFAVASGVDSRVILDQPGAERLLGRGDMLFQAPDAPSPARLQGVYVSDNEIQRLVQYWQGMAGTAQNGDIATGRVVDVVPSSIPLKQMPIWDELETDTDSDPLMEEAIDLCRRQGRASISMLQRRLRIGYTRAARLIEAMETMGIVGKPNPGTGTREILDYGPAAPPTDEN